jgi:hypothetical protein
MSAYLHEEVEVELWSKADGQKFKTLSEKIWWAWLKVLRPVLQYCQKPTKQNPKTTHTQPAIPSKTRASTDFVSNNTL